MTTTTAAGGPNEWNITDAPTHLREWDSAHVHPLPTTSSVGQNERIIGAAESCWLALRDSSGQVSRHHAKLTYNSEGKWTVTDLHSKNGITQDGARQVSIALSPGVELGIGGITLIVESERLRELRDLLGRFIGWSDERRLNFALRAVRMASTRREALHVYGDDDASLLSVARSLHLHTLGIGRPFALCARRPPAANPERWRKHKGMQRYDSGVEALAVTAGGTLCVRPAKPPDYAKLLEAHRHPSSRVQLIVCGRRPQRDPDPWSSIILRPLAERRSDIDRIIDGYAVDAGAERGERLAPSDREWIRSHESETLAQVETATRRFVMKSLRGGVTRAASELGMAHSTLSEWLARREGATDDNDRSEGDDDED